MKYQIHFLLLVLWPEMGAKGHYFIALYMLLSGQSACLLTDWLQLLTAMILLGVLIIDLELKPWLWLKCLVSGTL